MPTRPTTPEQKQDAVRLRALLDAWTSRAATPSARLTQEDIAHRLKTSQSALSQRLNGKLAMNRDFAAALANLIGCSVADFSPTLAREIDTLTQGKLESDDFAMVQRVDVHVSAGHGALVYEEGSKSALSFRRGFLQEIGVRPASAVIVTVKGRSMEPTIRDGSVLLVSTSARDVIDREIYAFRSDGHLYVKRMRRNGEAYVATSDNPDHEAFPDMHIAPNDPDVEIIGRALWMGSRL